MFQIFQQRRPQEKYIWLENKRSGSSNWHRSQKYCGERGLHFETKNFIVFTTFYIIKHYLKAKETIQAKTYIL